MNPELAQLIADIGSQLTLPTAWPSAAPANGSTRDEWCAEVARLRDQHDTLALEAARLCPHLPTSDQPAELVVEFVEVPVEPGRCQNAKIYRPSAERTDRPAVLLLHGGGWWMAGGAVAFELGDPVCRFLASELDAVVLNFDYRLAPEYPYPTPLDDAESAIDWLAASADSLGIDRRALSVFGVSAGGNLAAALARRLRGTERALRLQMLFVPALDLTFDSPACRADPNWQAEGARLCSYYVPPGYDPRDPDISPVLADDFSGLPPAIVAIGHHDPLRDDGTSYVAGLRDAGIDGVLLDYEMIHAVAPPDVADRWLHDIVEHAIPFLSTPTSVDGPR